MLRLVYPLELSNAVVTQTYDQHVQRARQNGWCSTPGTCPSGIYYYGGVDWGFKIDKTPAIWAAAPGEVIQIYRNQSNGYGLGAKILHDGGWKTVYAHFSTISVSLKDIVSSGSLLGRGGSTGNSTGPHLHFELRDANDFPVDPQSYFGEKLNPQFLPIFQDPVTAVVEAAILNVRDAPSVSSRIVSAIPQGTKIKVFSAIVKTPGKEVWLEIGYKQFCAAVYNGNIYVRFV